MAVTEYVSFQAKQEGITGNMNFCIYTNFYCVLKDSNTIFIMQCLPPCPACRLSKIALFGETKKGFNLANTKRKKDKLLLLRVTVYDLLRVCGSFFCRDGQQNGRSTRMHSLDHILVGDKWTDFFVDVGVLAVRWKQIETPSDNSRTQFLFALIFDYAHFLVKSSFWTKQ